MLYTFAILYKTYPFFKNQKYLKMYIFKMAAVSKVGLFQNPQIVPNLPLTLAVGEL